MSEVVTMPVMDERKPAKPSIKTRIKRVVLGIPLPAYQRSAWTAADSDTPLDDLKPPSRKILEQSDRFAPTWLKEVERIRSRIHADEKLERVRQLETQAGEINVDEVVDDIGDRKVKDMTVAELARALFEHRNAVSPENRGKAKRNDLLHEARELRRQAMAVLTDTADARITDEIKSITKAIQSAQDAINAAEEPAKWHRRADMLRDRLYDNAFETDADRADAVRELRLIQRDMPESAENAQQTIEKHRAVIAELRAKIDTVKAKRLDPKCYQWLDNDER